MRSGQTPSLTCRERRELSPVELCADLGVPELSQFHAGVALEPQQTADVKVTAMAAADLLRPGTPMQQAQTSTHERCVLCTGAAFS